jgi:hypothetical protein
MKYNFNSYLHCHVIKIIAWIIVIVIGLFIWFRLYGGNNVTEGFTWSRDLMTRFNKFQDTVNLNDHQFNLKVLQEQASPEEAEFLLQNGHWPWSKDTQKKYFEAVWQNPIIKFYPGAALEYAMKLYNETAAKRLLSWNTKEGQFLLYGGKSSDGSAIKCSNTAENNSKIQKTTLHGYNLWNGYKNTTTIDIPNESIPNVMPGFSFVNKPCNPCVILDDPNNFSCPFRLNVEGDDEISDIWKQLWNV